MIFVLGSVHCDLLVDDDRDTGGGRCGNGGAYVRAFAVGFWFV